jgi:hypothetical protein
MLVFPDVSKETLSLQLAEKGIGFPCIAKPDIGGKGWGVKKIYNWHDLYFYQSVCRVEFLLQELVTEPEEYSVFYCRYPSSETGFITSVTHKKLLTVTGDGMHTIDYLIRKDDRAFLQWKVLKKQGTIEMNRIPSKGVQGSDQAHDHQRMPAHCRSHRRLRLLGARLHDASVRQDRCRQGPSQDAVGYG